jgi:tetratricopeptide (TPR) repeat protein
MRVLWVAGLGLAAALFASSAATAGLKAAKGGQLTQQDVRSCMGLDGSDAAVQIQMCTKVINSGKVKAEFLGDYYATRGAAYLANRQPDKALADLNKALTLRQAPEFFVQRGLIHMTKRNWGAAKADLDQAIKLKPEFAPAYLMRGLASYQAGDYDDALTFFDEAVKRVPTYYQALYARGLAKKKTGDESGGETDIKAALGMRPSVDQEMKKFGLAPA